MVRGQAHDFGHMLRTELPKAVTSTLVRDAARLVPAAGQVRFWAKMKPGIRAQLIEAATGRLVQDFVIEGDSQSTHVLNAVSPGWTASLPFGRWVARQIEEKLQ